MARVPKKVYKPRPDNPRHKATGRPHGGPRPGAGRPPGSKNILPTGMVRTLKALNMRVPEKMTEGQEMLLTKSEEAILKVMEGKVHGSIAGAMLLAARTAREEICGPIAQKVQVQATIGIASLLDEVKMIEVEEEKTKVLEASAAEAARRALPAVAKAPVVRKKAADTIIDAALDAVAKDEETLQ